MSVKVILSNGDSRVLRIEHIFTSRDNLINYLYDVLDNKGKLLMNFTSIVCKYNNGTNNEFKIFIFPIIKYKSNLTHENISKILDNNVVMELDLDCMYFLCYDVYLDGEFMDVIYMLKTRNIYDVLKFYILANYHSTDPNVVITIRLYKFYNNNLIFYDKSPDLNKWGPSKISRCKNIVETNDYPLLDCISALMDDELILNKIMLNGNDTFRLLDNNFIINQNTDGCFLYVTKDIEFYSYMCNSYSNEDTHDTGYYHDIYKFVLVQDEFIKPMKEKYTNKLAITDLMERKEFMSINLKECAKSYVNCRIELRRKNNNKKVLFYIPYMVKVC